jgi:Na+/melibiose symporter-like transporter
MIVTAKKQVPWSWVILAAIPLAAVFFQGGVMGQAFIFTLKKFFDNPETITFIISIPPLVNMVVAAVVSLLSDRVWTRWGRRKPFLIFAWGKGIIFMPLMPLMPDATSLLVIYFISSLLGALSTPYEPLKQEIVPPPQRGMGFAFVRFLGEAKNLLFFFVMIGRFDDASFMGPLMITGEIVLYWTVGLMWLAMLLLLMLGIKESKTDGNQVRQPRTIGAMIKALFDPHLRNIYILIVGTAALGAGLGVMGTLVYTDQWGYSKQDMGTNIAIGAAFNLVIVFVVGYFADRWDRIKIFQFGIIVALLLKAVYYCYVTFVLPDQRPTLVEMVLFGEMIAVAGIIAHTVQSPMIFDYIERDRMGTYQAGHGLVSHLIGFVTINGVGWFVKGYSVLFMPPAGEATRIVLRADAERPVIEQRLQAWTWQDPAGGAAIAGTAIDARPWYATGRISDHGICYEVRLSDAGSDKLHAGERADAEKAKNAAGTRVIAARHAVEAAKRAGDDAAAAAAGAEMAIAEAEVAKAANDLTRHEAELKRRAEAFRIQVLAALAGDTVNEGDQIRAVRSDLATVIDLRADAVTTDSAEALLKSLRAADAGFIDLRTIRLEDETRGISVAMLAGSRTLDEGAAALRALVEAHARVEAPELLVAGGLAIAGQRLRPVAILELATVEEPLESLDSPVTRLALSVEGLFGVKPPAADRRLGAAAKAVRKHASFPLVRLSGRSGERVVVVSAVLAEGAAPSAGTGRAAALEARLTAIAPPEATPVAQLRQLYEAVEKACAGQRLTVIRPEIETGFAKLRYNYFSGYLWMMVLGAIGLLITVRFTRKVRRGEIRKLGVEEHQR